MKFKFKGVPISGYDMVQDGKADMMVRDALRILGVSPYEHINSVTGETFGKYLDPSCELCCLIVDDPDCDDGSHWEKARSDEQSRLDMVLSVEGDTIYEMAKRHSRLEKPVVRIWLHDKLDGFQLGENFVSLSDIEP